jgi:hypothetical protein
MERERSRKRNVESSEKDEEESSEETPAVEEAARDRKGRREIEVRGGFGKGGEHGTTEPSRKFGKAKEFKWEAQSIFKN